ncbi:MAG: D-glycero-beta-D-manno-heptose-7-phosphate kinase [Proteobacteria bacterium]|nr:D-glycero-beta-D-manno-heptose-7-phosphate kinase [Pseudomonadota bacterium]
MNLHSLTDQQILVIGDVMLDCYVWGDVSRISPEAPVPVVKVGEKTDVMGGAGNVASNLAGLGCSVTLIGVKGNDAAGNRLGGLCLEKGIESALVTIKQRPTTTKTRIMARKQQLFRLDEEEIRILDDTEKKAILSLFEDKLPSSDAVILSDYGKGIMQTPGMCQELIALCKTYRVPSLVDPKGKNWERYTGATCITPNTLELETISETSFDHDEDILMDIVSRTKKKYKVKCLVLTRGSKGMFVADSDIPPLFLPTQAREVFDVSGAGDTVIATLAAGVASGLSFIKAAELANIAAGIVVGKVGTQPVNLMELDLAIQEKAMHGQDKIEGYYKLDSVIAAKTRIQSWKSKKETVVFTNGCFDLLHPGHVDLLHKARELGDRLVVGLNSDLSVTRLKGEKRPILAEQDRAAILSALSCVDLVVIFSEDTPLSILEILKPDILVKGADYKPEDVVGKDLVESYGGKICLVPLIDGYSTSGIEKRILERS